MLKNKEFKIGVIVLVACIIAYYGILYLKNNGLTQKKQHLYFTYNTTTGFAVNMPLIVNGAIVGKVEKIRPRNEEYNEFVFTLSIIQDVHIPKNSTLQIEQNLLKNNQLVLQLGNEETLFQNNDTIQIDASLLKTKDDFKALMSKTGNVSDSINLLISNFNQVMDVKLKQNIHVLLTNLVSVTQNMQQFSDALIRSQAHITNSFKNIDNISAVLNKESQQLHETMSNLNKFSATLNTLQLNQLLEHVDTAVMKIKAVGDKLTHKEGTLGLLVNDKKLYENLDLASKNLNSLIVDIKANPSRYVNISVFNKAKKSFKDTTNN